MDEVGEQARASRRALIVPSAGKYSAADMRHANDSLTVVAYIYTDAPDDGGGGKG
jgi:hypothetical protein